jgi:hypothetical protein
MNRSRIKLWAVRVAIALIPVGYLAACSYESHRGEAALAEVQKGDSEGKVIGFFGPPTTREHQGTGYRRYVNDECVSPCVERLWFENRLSIVDEAWFVALDKDRRVLKAAHLISP